MRLVDGTSKMRHSWHKQNGQQDSYKKGTLMAL
jgi:hypothetical protein